MKCQDSRKSLSFVKFAQFLVVITIKTKAVHLLAKGSLQTIPVGGEPADDRPDQPEEKTYCRLNVLGQKCVSHRPSHIVHSVVS